MYVDDPGLDTLLSLTSDEFLLCSGEDALAAVGNNDPDLSGGSPRNKQLQLDKSNDGKQALMCMYPNCDKSYLKPSHLKVNSNIIVISILDSIRGRSMHRY